MTLSLSLCVCVCVCLYKLRRSGWLVRWVDLKSKEKVIWVFTLSCLLWFLSNRFSFISVIFFRAKILESTILDNTGHPNKITFRINTLIQLHNETDVHNVRSRKVQTNVWVRAQRTQYRLSFSTVYFIPSCVVYVQSVTLWESHHEKRRS